MKKKLTKKKKKTNKKHQPFYCGLHRAVHSQGYKKGKKTK